MPIDVLAIADTNHEDDEFGIFNAVQDAISILANSIALHSG